MNGNTFIIHFWGSYSPPVVVAHPRLPFSARLPLQLPRSRKSRCQIPDQAVPCQIPDQAVPRCGMPRLCQFSMFLF